MLARGVSRRRKVQIANFVLKEPYGACSPTKSFQEPRVMRRHKIRGFGDENGIRTENLGTSFLF